MSGKRKRRPVISSEDEELDAGRDPPPTRKRPRQIRNPRRQTNNERIERLERMLEQFITNQSATSPRPIPQTAESGTSQQPVGGRPTQQSFESETTQHSDGNRPTQQSVESETARQPDRNLTLQQETPLQEPISLAGTSTNTNNFVAPHTTVINQNPSTSRLVVPVASDDLLCLPTAINAHTLSTTSLSPSTVPYSKNTPIDGGNNLRFITKPENVPKFDGDTNALPVHTWLHRLEALAKIYGWDERTLIYHMTASLTGNALLWFNHLCDIDMPWEDWKKRLIEYFPTGRGLAAKLHDFVTVNKRREEKDEVRICKILFDTEIGKKYGGQAVWHHVPCFEAVRDNLGYLAGGEDLPGFKNLSKEDQKIVKDTIRPKSIDGLPIKKPKMEPKDEEDIKKEKDHEKLLAKQNKLFHKHRGALSEYKKPDLHELMEFNNMEIPTGADKCLDRLADCMAFGVPEPCPECKGELVLDTFNYKCTGSISEWTKCSYTTTEPKKSKFKVPKAFKQGSAFHKYKPSVAVRAFECAPPPPPLPVIKKEEPAVKKNIPIPPLKNLQFFIYGKVKSKEDVKHRILKLGGLVTSKLTDTLAAVVSTKKDLEAMNTKMGEIQEADIEVVEESFLDLIDPATGTVSKTLELIKMNNIADWGSDPAKRVPQDVIDGKSIPKSGSMYVKSGKSGTTKLKIKGGTAVDPDSGLDHVAHVYRDGDGAKYTVVLCKTDVVEQKNSYYKLQVLEADHKNKYWVFRSWGRIGTTIGGNKTEECKSLSDATNKFENLYMEKTDNPWEFRDDFMKVPGGYFPIEVDYGQDDADGAGRKLQLDKSSKLPEPVQKLVVKIFDIDIMKKTLLEFELDTEKMPLGKLSKKQIKAGYKVLTELLKYIEQGKASENKIKDATNRFFSTVPHDFGVNNAPLLDSVDAIKRKAEMLDNLLEIEIAYSLLKTDSEDTTSPIEQHYSKLKANIAPLDKAGDEFKMIMEYVTNTHAATHSGYTLEVEEVFKVVREGEDKRYKPFRKLHNRRLLWHGSRITNFAGILSQGLRIAPPEAPVTGYMFGKGVYFADMVSKSANYCCTSRSNPTGIMLLCEVALGDMKKCHQAEMITKLPPGLHSAWGVGRTQPDPAAARALPGGALVPLGRPVTDNKLNTSLLYNEFIVYDVAQVNVQYLLQMKFNHKY